MVLDTLKTTWSFPPEKLDLPRLNKEKTSLSLFCISELKVVGDAFRLEHTA